MTTPLTRIGAGRYRHPRLGVEIERTSTADHPWELAGPDPQGSGVVLARTLGDARAFLQEVEATIPPDPELRPASSLDRAQELLLLGEAVRFAREQRDLSPTALAAASGVPASRIEAVEAGRLDPDYELLIALARALHTRPSAFVLRDEALAAGDRSLESGPTAGDDAERALLALHRYLFPERYADVPTYEWHACTIEDVAAMLE
ncbi:MAG: helix-turn-helix domain-containing protein, partial [Solirubrobacterales bacterium]